MRRTNFFADLVGEIDRPGVQAIISRLKAQGDLSPGDFVDGCLDLMGPLEIDQSAGDELVDHASEDGPLEWRTEQESESSSQRIGEMLQLVVSLREYQFA